MFSSAFQEHTYATTERHKALVDDAKLLDYVLSETHPVGKHHARLFADLLGIRSENVHVLRAALFAAADQADAVEGQPSRFGRKFEVRFAMNGSAGLKIVLSVWIIEPAQVAPRLVTCYIE